MNCRHCEQKINDLFLDLGFAPLSNSYLTEADLGAPETTYPLKLRVCRNCWLVQTEDYSKADEIFSDDYAYFSSTSKSWLKHAKQYCEMTIERFKLDGGSHIIEVASNDGYLLRNFVTAGIPCLGIEPTLSTAEASRKLGIPVEKKFFSLELASQLVAEGRAADLIIGNNVYAHVPDINDFTAGLAQALKPEGVITLEFPHLMRLVEQCQFDTVYHEHFSYLSATVVERIFTKAGLRIFDIEELTTHGGSLRIYGCHNNSKHVQTQSARTIIELEKSAGLRDIEYYQGFQSRVNRIKDDFVRFLIDTKMNGKHVAAYGAAAKGNTLINYAGIRSDLIEYVCDAAPSKQGKFLPGSHIPIVSPEHLLAYPPDFLIVLPWNIKSEIIIQLRGLIGNRTKFLVAVPELEII